MRVDLNVRDMQGRTPLHCISTNPILTSFIPKVCRHHRADPNIRDNKGRTALHLAARMGLEDTVDALLSVDGVCADIVDIRGNTALHLAATAEVCEYPGYVNFENVVDQLLHFCGDAMHIWNDKGKLPLDLALEGNNEDIVKVLLREQY